MPVRAKMFCNKVTEHGGAVGNQFDVSFFPVTGGSGENEVFFKYTPAGSLELNGLKQDFGFKPGKEYYVDISEAE